MKKFSIEKTTLHKINNLFLKRQVWKDKYLKTFNMVDKINLISNHFTMSHHIITMIFIIEQNKTKCEYSTKSLKRNHE